jgi:hypothetical protein
MKSPEAASNVGPRAPKRHYSARFGPDVSVVSAFEASLKPLFRQFHGDSTLANWQRKG